MFASYVSQGLERLVQSVAYFSRINGPNENSGGGGGREEGSCIQTFYVVFLNLANSPSLLVERAACRPLLSNLTCP